MQVTLPDCDVLCVYGFPDPSLYAELQNWLNDKEERFLIILEEDEKIFLEGVSSDERIFLCNPLSEESVKSVLWQTVFLRFACLDVPGNSLKDSQRMQTILQRVAIVQQNIDLFASDFQMRGIDILTNTLKNIERTPPVLKGDSLFGKFQKIPAVICGAGFSLEKQRELLEGLEDRALIFAGGAALSKLSEFKIEPHFAAFVDPHPLTKYHSQNSAFEVPLLFASRAQSFFVMQMQGPHFLFPSNGGQLMEKWLFGETLECGWNVVTFLTQMAYQAGCDPIIFAGVDLCQNFASPGWIPIGEKYTKEDFLAAAKWLGDFAKEHPERKWFNLSKQGLPIEGVSQKSDLRFERAGDLRGRIHSLSVLSEKYSLQQKKEELLQSFSKVEAQCHHMLDLLEKSFPNSPENGGQYALIQVETEEEVAYKHFFAPIWDVWRHVFQRKIPKAVPKAFGIEINKWIFMKEICECFKKNMK